MVEMLAARAAVAIETATLYAGEAMQRAWLRNIIDQLPEGVVILDRMGHVVTDEPRPAGVRARGSGRARSLGQPGHLRRAPAGRDAVPFPELPVVRALEQGETVAGEELAVRRADGRQVPVLTNAAPVRDEAGRITGATLVLRTSRAQGPRAPARGVGVDHRSRSQAAGERDHADGGRAERRRDGEVPDARAEGDRPYPVGHVGG